MDCRIRPALASDTAFLFALLHSARGTEIEHAWGDNDEWQRRNFDAHVEKHLVSIIEAYGQAAGSLWLDRRADVLHVADLQILPEMRGQGIGTAVLQELVAHAHEQGVPVSLVVRLSNTRARRLYERLGFTVTGADANWVHMQLD